MINRAISCFMGYYESGSDASCFADLLNISFVKDKEIM